MPEVRPEGRALKIYRNKRLVAETGLQHAQSNFDAGAAFKIEWMSSGNSATAS